MAKFWGAVGFAHSVKTSPGIVEEVMTERSYFGDEVRASRQLQYSETINPDLTVGTSIRIVADGYANSNIFAMRYIRWMGALWVVENAIPERPRILLTLGGVYNGPTATTPDPPGGDAGD